MEDQRGLIDRLVVATEEQDVLWVLVTIGEMKELGCLKEAINATHWWKGYSALESIARLSSLSNLHKLIAQMLLLAGATETLGGEVNEQVEELIEKRRQGNNEGDRDALHLLSLGLAQAADWIDENSLLPPNPEALTGGGPLPSPPHLEIELPGSSSLESPVQGSNSSTSPSFKSDSNLSKPQTDFESSNTLAADDTSSDQVGQTSNKTLEEEKVLRADLDLKEANPSPQPPIQKTSRLPQSSIPGSNSQGPTRTSYTPLVSDSRLPDAPESCDPISHSQSKPTLSTLFLVGLPFYCSRFLVAQIFTDIRVEVKEIQVQPNRAYVQVESSRAQYCVDSLHLKKIVGDSVISCYASKGKTKPSETTNTLPQKPSRLPSNNERIDPPSQQNKTSYLFPSPASILPVTTNILPPHSELHLAGLPPYCNSVAEITRILHDFGIEILGCRLGKYDPVRRDPFAFIVVENCNVKRCIKAVNGKLIGSYSLSLNLSKTSLIDSHPLPSLPTSRSPSPPRHDVGHLSRLPAALTTSETPQRRRPRSPSPSPDFSDSTLYPRSHPSTSHDSTSSVPYSLPTTSHSGPRLPFDSRTNSSIERNSNHVKNQNQKKKRKVSWSDSGLSQERD